MIEDEKEEIKENNNNNQNNNVANEQDEGKFPIKHAIYSFFSFILIGFLPLLVYCIYVISTTDHKAGSLGANITFGVSSLVTLVSLILMGAMRARVSRRQMITTTLISVCFCLFCGCVAFFVGFGLEKAYESNVPL